jgi:hypothetical protein
MCIPKKRYFLGISDRAEACGRQRFEEGELGGSVLFSKIFEVCSRLES